MSYYVDFRGGEFHIEKKNMGAAADALREYRRGCGYDVGHNESLVELLDDCCWRVEDLDDDGGIAYMYLDDNVIGDEEDWFKVIAPYVKPGSYLVFEGEDGHIWCWYFNGRDCTAHVGTIIFPDLQSNSGDEIAICT